jgi:hypothetical protein
MLLMIKFIFLVRHSLGSFLEIIIKLGFSSLENSAITAFNQLDALHLSPRRSGSGGSIVESGESFNDAEWEKFVDFPVLYGLLRSRRFLAKFHAN